MILDYLLNALIKLTIRFQQGAQINRVKNILAQNTGNLNVEIQQRAVEYQNLFNFDDIRKGVVERMPPPEIREENRVLGETPKKGKAARKALNVKTSAQKDLLDILGGGEKSPDTPSVFAEKAKNEELLKDLFGPSPAGPSTNGSTSQPARSNVSDILDLFGSTGAGGAAAVPPPAIQAGGINNLDALFGRTAEPTPSASQSYGRQLK